MQIHYKLLIRRKTFLYSPYNSAQVNSSDRVGVLEGRWAETFPEGNPPWHWSGSIEILEQFWKTKEAVKYGQCWVFSGVLTSCT